MRYLVTAPQGCPGCPRTGYPHTGCSDSCYHEDWLWCWALIAALVTMSLLASIVGCVPSQPLSDQSPFEVNELEGCLAIVVDMSGRFSESWDEQAYPLMLRLMDQFFTQGAGAESRVVLAQLSGDEQVVLFEGRPEDLRARFRAPEELAAFLHERSDPSSSPVYRTIGRALEYVTSVPGVTEQTRVMTVVLSDLADNQQRGDARTANTKRLVTALKKYQQLGGGLAMYCVAPDETSRWREILSLAGFVEGRYAIESNLVARPRLPRFE